MWIQPEEMVGARGNSELETCDRAGGGAGENRKGKKGCRGEREKGRGRERKKRSGTYKRGGRERKKRGGTYKRGGRESVGEN